MRAMKLPIVQVRASGGGARSELWRSIQADVTNTPHVTINVDEGPALGVALLAGVGTGAFGSVAEACQAVIRVVGSTEVCNVNRVAYDRYYAVYRQLYPQLRDQFAAVGKLVA
jgi:xylulokinase